MLAGVGAVGLRGAERHRHHPVTALAYGSALALVVDELALLLDLKDVYWANDGRKSVDVAITMIAGGGTVVAGLPFGRRRTAPFDPLTRPCGRHPFAPFTNGDSKASDYVMLCCQNADDGNPG